MSAIDAEKMCEAVERAYYALADHRNVAEAQKILAPWVRVDSSPEIQDDAVKEGAAVYGRPTWEPPHKALLVYFKPSGKFYCEATLEIRTKCSIRAIWALLEAMGRTRTLPGLTPGHDAKLVYVTVPGHPEDHPTLLGLPKATDPFGCQA